MPRSGAKKGGKVAPRPLEADVRLTDYADATLPSAESGRVSKAVTVAAKSARETRHWWECDEEDFLDDLLPGDGEQLDEDNSEDDAGQTELSDAGHLRTLGCFTPVDGNRQVSSINYPFDLWFLVSKYIRPEDVGRFALICPRSYAVTKSSAFWRLLYHRFSDPKLSTNIPEQFRPLALRRPYGLRTRVIKALHFSYGHFLDRTRCSNGVSLSEAALEKLYQGVCVSAWWEHQRDGANGKAVWRFYFKFASRRQAEELQRGRNVRLRLTRSDGPLDYLDDTWANLEEGCCVLKVACGQFTQIPPVLSWRLSELSVSLCSDMRSHRLRLVFLETGANKSTSKKYGVKEIAVMDSVQMVAVFDWWHPNYPLAVL